MPSGRVGNAKDGVPQQRALPRRRRRARGRQRLEFPRSLLTIRAPARRSVPSGRVGNAKDAVFRSNEHFRGAVGEREGADVAELEHRLDRRLEPAERARIGVTQLRRFLEQLLQRRCGAGPSSCGPALAVASLYF